MWKESTHFLIVDDMAAVRQMVKFALSLMGYKVTTQATDGDHALRLLEEAQEKGDPFGFVISDWNMERMSGFDLLKTVRATTWGRKLPFMLLTAETQKAQIVSAIQEGADDYLIKPFTQDAFQIKINRIYQRLHPDFKKSSVNKSKT